MKSTQISTHPSSPPAAGQPSNGTTDDTDGAAASRSSHDRSHDTGNMSPRHDDCPQSSELGAKPSAR